MLFGVICGPSYERVENHMRELEPFVDGFEFRLDLFQEIKDTYLKKIIAGTSKQILFTLRKKSHGGSCYLSESERENRILSLCQLRPTYVDIEYDVNPDLFHQIKRKHPKLQIVSSYHNFETTPEDLDAILKQMQTTQADVYKIACMSNSSLDLFRLMDFIKKRSKRMKIIGVSMGKTGTPSRILGPIIGNWIDYASPSSHVVAPGSYSVEDLYSFLYDKLEPTSPVYALLGTSETQSLSPLVHNVVLKKLNRKGVYIKLCIDPAELKSSIDWMKRLGFFRGISVTTPHKEAIISFLDSLDPSSVMIGSVNTISVEDGLWKGYNTDGVGAITALLKKTSLEGKKVCVLGCGGAAKAIIFALKQNNAEVVILNRSLEKARLTAQIFSCNFGMLSELADLMKDGVDILINATSSEMPIEAYDISDKCIVMDLHTLPKNTEFLKTAADKSCPLIYGYEMFIEQAALQQEIWFSTHERKEKSYIEEAVSSYFSL